MTTEKKQDVYEQQLDDEIKILVENIKKMKTIKTYDVHNLVKSYNHQLRELHYFYSIANKSNNKYIVLHHSKVKKHTLMYVNLGRGFPKEFMDGHWCYIVKTIANTKALIIPTASLKGNEKIGCLQSVIESYSPESIVMIYSKLKFADIRTIDMQRIYYSKGVYAVKTSRSEIMKRLLEVVS